ncbi:LysR family transcriptional regulator [Luteibacter sp. 22Crub2.1]|uniref:LysR family transcriptional regulator n=1 Tax=Luteibacter sp. 22Crub2.1 TaxID=1283288 RepID=UPI0009A6B487|nr:LysR family transcriptional regulator [Luteibacter sp. 22Crub2.1]SKB88470.1 DNA-binding transcriptional regulator, LysR family [Luteibacter sp. 22Crub2.1]
MDALEADQLLTFLAVVDTGSFTAAARRLERDASVVSRRVAALEARLGIRLLERSTRRVSATEAGMQFRERVRQAMDLVRTAEDEARDFADAPSGLLRVTLAPAFGRMWVAPRLTEFLALHPSVRIEASFSDRYVDMVAEGFDVAVRIGEMKDSRLISQRVAPAGRMICAAPSYLERRPPLTTPDDLTRHDCLGFTPMFTHPVWHLQRGREERAVKVAGRIESDDIHALVSAAVAGAGVLMAADWLVAHELADGRLVPVLDGWRAKGETGIYVIRASTRHAPAKTRAFVEWLAEVLAPAPWGYPVSPPSP